MLIGRELGRDFDESEDLTACLGAKRLKMESVYVVGGGRCRPDPKKRVE